MIDQTSSLEVLDAPMSYEALEDVLKELAAGISPPEVDELVAAVSESGEGGTDAPLLEPTPVPDVTQNWSKAAFEGVIESLPDAIVVIDGDGLIRMVNGQTEKMFGYRRGEMYGWQIELLVPMRFRAGHVAKRNRYLANPQFQQMGERLESLFGRRKNGSEFPVEISLSPIESENGALVASTIRDITQKKQAEAQLQSAEKRYRTLVEEIPAVTFMAALDGGVQELYVSPQIEELLQFSQKEWLENPILWYTQLHPDDQERWHKEFARTCSTGEHFQSEYRFMARDGSVVWVHGEAKMVRDDDGRPLFLQGVAFDITDRKNAEETLRRANEELDGLVTERTKQLAVALEEVHHRTKNNLGVIDVMLKLKDRALDDPKATPVFTDMRRRVKAIAEIHEQLYKSDDLSRIDFSRYVTTLGRNLIQTYRDDDDVRLNIEIDDVFFGIKTASPCGLIVNELLSNCLKYAFPKGPGEIVVSLRPQDGNFLLTIRDNGIGFPEDLDIDDTESLGMEIVTSQVEQLDGEIQLTRSPGTTFEITLVEQSED